ncbi:tail tape measure protein [Halorubrum tailed virus 28]|uniref:Tail tape measure protein n=1 Tax=Halorubrum tailed virus 28 TaxID=2878009 RepID=A0AAE8Y1Z4_9CAUD|nr:tail tape measure protein [Halorubrum tailed virus 28]UBF23473.1 tail tape measure protein [Halorubrum tailed virus 28]
MSVRELVFSYTTKGAKQAAREDQRVRSSIRETGRAANRQAGTVRRWAERNRQAIQTMAASTLAFAGAIASASPTLRANLGGVRAGVTLLADQIVRDLLPSGNSLATLAVDIARKFTRLDKAIRRPISAIAAVATAFSVVALIAGPIAAGVSAIFGAMSTLVGVLGTVASAVGTAVTALATILGVSAAVVAGLAALVAAVAALAIAFIVDFRGIRTKTIQFLTQLLAGARTRLMALLEIARNAARSARDAAVRYFGQLKERVLSLLDLGRDLAQTGKEWVGGLVRGVRDRASDLVAAFRSMAARVAGAFRDRFNALIPSSISIPSVTIDIPDILGGSRSFGGGSLRLPQLDTGGRIASDGLAMLHAGERIMPAAQVRERGPQPTGDSGTTIEEVNITVQAMGDDPVGTGRGIAREFERELSDRGA